VCGCRSDAGIQFASAGAMQVDFEVQERVQFPRSHPIMMVCGYVVSCVSGVADAGVEADWKCISL
jgi:hypothetical protein